MSKGSFLCTIMAQRILFFLGMEKNMKTNSKGYEYNHLEKNSYTI